MTRGDDDMSHKNNSFLFEAGCSPLLTCSDLRMILLCYKREMPSGEIMRITGWNRQNTSRTARRLTGQGILRVRKGKHGLIYQTNDTWRLPDIPGQLSLPAE